MAKPTKLLLMAATVALAATSAGAAAFAANGQISNPDNCNVVERNQSNGGNGVSTSVAAGNGKVSTQSGGSSVTVHSGNGASTSTATTGSGGGTTVTNSNGNCTIYVHPGDKEEH